MTNPSSVRLPVQFEAEFLQRDLAKVRPTDWIKHYRKNHYLGDWAVAPLRSVGGHPAIIYATPSGGSSNFYQDTELLGRCQYFKEVLEWFQCPLHAVRLMRLGSGAQILEHTDDMEFNDHSEWRLHIPVQTHSEVQFWLDGTRLRMQVGEVWYADFNKPHKVDNPSPLERVHLVLDCTPNDWLRLELDKGISKAI